LYKVVHLSISSYCHLSYLFLLFFLLLLLLPLLSLLKDFSFFSFSTSYFITIIRGQTLIRLPAQLWKRIKTKRKLRGWGNSLAQFLTSCASCRLG
jgi:hypothetical protein